MAKHGAKNGLARRGLADTGKGTVAKPATDLPAFMTRLADTGKGTVAKLRFRGFFVVSGLADTGKGTVAKQMCGIVRQYIGLCQVFATGLRSYCAVKDDF